MSIDQLRARLAARRARKQGDDEGSALIMALVCIIVCSLIVIPLLDYASAVGRSSRVQRAKSLGLEAAKAGLRVALADPIGLYKACNNAGMTVAVNLAGPGLNTGVTSQCFKMNQAAAEDPNNIRYGVATTKVGSLPPAGLSGAYYPGSGLAPENAWVAQSTQTPTKNMVWAPLLPAHALNKRSVAGYSMPSGFAACTVYFPGTYQDDLIISGSTPVYFASGVYYFEKKVEITGNATVVVGGGAAQGCTSDQEAAFYATNAPAAHNIDGLGATFIFGDQGRLMVDNTVAGTASSIVFNQRYVAATDINALPSAGVSIMTVNGQLSGTSGVDLNIPGSIYVPASQVGGTTPSPATSQEYLPSTFVPPGATGGSGTTTTTAATTTTTIAGTTTTAPASGSQTPVVDINLTTSASVTVTIPGYIAVPQGLVRVNIASGMQSTKAITVSGGVLASGIEFTGSTASTFSFGLVNPVVQQTFKIISKTTSTSPQVISTAIVQINQNGAYAINSWEVQ